MKGCTVHGALATNALAIVLPASVALGVACAAPSRRTASVEPVYDQANHRLVALRYDRDHDGRADVVSEMDGARVLRTAVDTDRDGVIDRWEYYDAAQQLVRVGFSRAGDGKEDAWSFAGPDHTVTRIELSTARDGKVDRTERYESLRLVTAEEDTDRDGVVDKWETYDHGRLAIVAFDPDGRGTPSRRLVYDSSGAARVEALDTSVTLRTPARR